MDESKQIKPRRTPPVSAAHASAARALRVLAVVDLLVMAIFYRIAPPSRLTPAAVISTAAFHLLLVALFLYFARCVRGGRLIAWAAGVTSFGAISASCMAFVMIGYIAVIGPTDGMQFVVIGNLCILAGAYYNAAVRLVVFALRTAAANQSASARDGQRCRECGAPVERTGKTE